MVALDIFDELIECEIGIVIPHIKSIAEFCLALASEPSLDDSIRIKVRILVNMASLQPKLIILYIWWLKLEPRYTEYNLIVSKQIEKI